MHLHSSALSIKGAVSDRRLSSSFYCDTQTFYLKNAKNTLFLIVAGVLFFSNSLAGSKILVLKSHHSPPYEQTLKGFQNRLADSGLDVIQQISTIDSNINNPILQNKQLQPPPDLVFTLGTPATQTILALAERPPTVAALIFNASGLKQQQNITAVALAHSADTQWRHLRRLLPDARNIAILYNPTVSQATFQALQKLANTEKINLQAIKVNTRKDLPLAIRRLSPQLDALMALDASILNNAAIRQLLLFSFRNRIPLVGLSAHWVKAGALYALDWDYYDIGEQSAELALDILQRHKSPSALPPQPPRKTRLVYNPKTVEYMKLKPGNWRNNNLIEVTP